MLTMRCIILVISFCVQGFHTKSFDATNLAEMRELISELDDLKNINLTQKRTVGLDDYFATHDIRFKYDVIQDVVIQYYSGFPDVSRVVESFSVTDSDLEGAVANPLRIYGETREMRVALNYAAENIAKLVIAKKSQCTVDMYDTVLLYFFDKMYDLLQDEDDSTSFFNGLKSVLTGHAITDPGPIARDLIDYLHSTFFGIFIKEALTEKYTDLDIFITKATRLAKDVIVEWEHNNKNISVASDRQSALDLINKRLISEIRPKYPKIFRCSTKNEMIADHRRGVRHFFVDMKRLEASGELLRTAELRLTEQLPEAPSDALMNQLDAMFEGFTQHVLNVAGSQDIAIVRQELTEVPSAVIAVLGEQQKKDFTKLWDRVNAMTSPTPAPTTKGGTGSIPESKLLKHFHDDLVNMKKIKQFLSTLSTDNEALLTMLQTWTQSKQDMLSTLGV